MPNGGKYWRFNYRFQGKYKTLALGVYPDVSLAKARERLSDSKARLSDGFDPGVEKIVAAMTFEIVARKWYERWEGHRNSRYADCVLKRLEDDVFPIIGHSCPSDIPASTFRDVVRKIESRGALEIAKRVLQNCGQIMRFAVANDYATRNPVAGTANEDDAVVE